jgi:CRP-like cAMP-binding protein
MEVLKNHSLFTGLTEEAVRSAVSVMAELASDFKKNEYLAKEGDRIKHFGILISGSATSSIKYKNLPPKIVRFYQQHELVCLETALSDQGVSPVSARGAGNGRVLWLSYGRLFEAGPQAIAPRAKDRINKNLHAIIASNSIRLEKVSYMMSMHGMRDRLLTYLLIVSETLESQTFSIGMKQYELAAYLGVSKARLSVELRRLQEEGIILYDVADSRFTICEDLAEHILRE